MGPGWVVSPLLGQYMWWGDTVAEPKILLRGALKKELVSRLQRDLHFCF